MPVGRTLAKQGLRASPVSRPLGMPVVLFDFTSGTLPNGAALTRSSVGTRVNAAGALVSEAANIARFDYAPATPYASRGLLVEPASTNQSLYSQDWTQTAGWIAISVVAGNPTAIIEDTSTAFHGLGGTVNRSLTAGQSVTTSVIASERTGSAKRYLVLSWPSALFGTSPMAVFDLASGTITFTANSTAACVAAPGGWLCSMTATPTSSSASAAGEACRLSNVSTAVVSYAGDGTSGLNVSEAQAETGATATSRIRSTATTATRAADALTANWGGKGVADGAITVRYTFDNGATQDVATTVSGGTAVMPTNLNRARIRFAQKI